jgi:lathosterol oxidase
MQDPSLTTLALTAFSMDLLRYLLAAGSVWLLVSVLLRHRLRGRRILGSEPRAGQIRRELTYSLATVVIFASHGVMLWLWAAKGCLRLYSDVADHGWAWWWASLALIVVAHDAYFYWTHRLLHRRGWFQHVHARHHASIHPTPWAAYSFHPVEAMIQALFLPLFLLAVPTHGAVVGVFLVHMIVRNCIGHCGHELFAWRWTPRGWLRWLTPVTHHHFHHTRNQGNYGLYFTWWDRWCGTEDASYLRYGDAHFAASRRAGAEASATARLE